MPNIFTESKIASCYVKNAVSKDLSCQLVETSLEKILSILKGLIKPTKAAVYGCLLVAKMYFHIQPKIFDI